jgi:hypothetical protein
METNVVAFPPLMGQPLSTAELKYVHDWESGAWTVRRDGRRIAVVREKTIHVWANHKGRWNWRIDYRDGGRISGRDCNDARGALCLATWGDCCRYHWGERAA